MSTHSWFGDAVRSKNRQMELEAERRLVAEKNNARLQAAEAPGRGRSVADDLGDGIPF